MKTAPRHCWIVWYQVILGWRGAWHDLQDAFCTKREAKEFVRELNMEHPIAELRNVKLQRVDMK